MLAWRKRGRVPWLGRKALNVFPALTGEDFFSKWSTFRPES